MILAKENNYWKHRSKEAYFITILVRENGWNKQTNKQTNITKHKDKAPLLNKKTKCPTISNIWKPIL